MSAKHGIAGAVFLVLIAGPVVRAQNPTDLPFFKAPSPAEASVESSIPGQTPATGLPMAQQAPNSYQQGQPSPYGTTSAPQPPYGTMVLPGPQIPGGMTVLPGQPMPGGVQLPNGMTVVPGQPLPNGMPGQQLPNGMTVLPGQQQLSPLTVLPGKQPLPEDAFAVNPSCAGSGANCCGPIGAHGPIGTEFWVSTGPSFIIGGGNLASALKTGWDVEGGGRTLFYSTDGHTAWSIDASVFYTANGGDLGHLFQGNYGPGDNVTIHFLNRSGLRAGLGRDWWFCGPGDVGSNYNPNFCFGVNGGGTYGTSHVDLNSPIPFGNYERIQKIYGGTYAGIHFDMEVPLGAWTFVTGIQANWTDDFLHVLPGGNNIQGINLLWNVGFRY